jgi:Lrp/AsnC family transcriptional regulator
MILRGAVEMDTKDLKILALLQENATITVAEIASRVHLSQTPVWRRIQRLEADGIIERRVALVNPASVGFSLSVFVEIQAPDHSREWLGQFMGAVAEMPEVMEVHRMAGEIDYLLRVAVRNMEDYDHFYQRLAAQVNAKNITSRFSMERLKATTAFPLTPSKPANGARLSG